MCMFSTRWKGGSAGERERQSNSVEAGPRRACARERQGERDRGRETGRVMRLGPNCPTAQLKTLLRIVSHRHFAVMRLSPAM